MPSSSSTCGIYSTGASPMFTELSSPLKATRCLFYTSVIDAASQSPSTDRRQRGAEAPLCPHYTNSKTDLHPDDAHQFLHRVGALLQGGLLFRGQLDLDDLLDAVRAPLARYADEQPVDTVFAFEIGGARHDLLLVLEDGLNHLRDRGRRRVVSAAGLEMLHDLGATVARALHQACDGGCVHQLGGRSGRRR